MEPISFFVIAKPVFVILHALSAAIGLGAVVTTDSLFFKFLKDFKISQKERETLDTISKVIWGAIIALFLTGTVLYFSAPLVYLAKSKFVAKLVIFIVIVVNGVALNLFVSPYLVKISFNENADKLKKSLKLRLFRRIAFASGALSIVSWLAVFLLGSVRSIPLSTGSALGIYFAIALSAMIGSQIFAFMLRSRHH